MNLIAGFVEENNPSPESEDAYIGFSYRNGKIIASARNRGLKESSEFEIPLGDFKNMINSCNKLIKDIEHEM